MELEKREFTVLVSGVASDPHTWNLVFLQLLLEELGHRVVNIGARVPDDLLIASCVRHRPDLVVVSSVNGRGHHDGVRVITGLRSHPDLTGIPVVIGGRLGIGGAGDARRTDDLLRAGFDAVFDDGAPIAAFREYVDGLGTLTAVTA
ncbi:MAG: cobalamin-dependent protein [Umezawaea sp.]